LTNRLEIYDLAVDDFPHIICFFRSDCVVLEEYSNCIGTYSRNHFLQRFNIPEIRGQRPLEVNREDHNLIISSTKQIVSGDVPKANIYTFEVNPYDILDFAHVYRRDELPSLYSEEDSNFQRPLIVSKIKAIRENLLTNPDFMFPNSILAVLSNNCRYDEESASLIIPQTYEAISIIDGQHRLFSYANDDVKNIMDENCKIIITAILFEEADANEIHRYSSKAFVEINRNQTGIQRKHLDAIAYDLLREIDGRALAAKILFETNKRIGHSLYGLFETNKRLTGILKATTIITVLSPIANIKVFRGLENVRAGSNRDTLKTGYLNFYGVERIGELTDPDVIIRHGICGLERFFSILRKTFIHDWPKPGFTKNSSLEFAKVIAGFVQLLRQFIAEGMTWKKIESELISIRENIMQLRELREYNSVLFDPTHPAIPDSGPRYSDNHKFLEANRNSSTSIKKILREREKRRQLR